MRILLVLLVVVVSGMNSHAWARSVEPKRSAAEPAPASSWNAGIVPRFAFDQDSGFGIGARGTFFYNDKTHQPYRTAISFQAFVTHKLVQSHFVEVDSLDAFGLPLRLNAAIGYYQTLSQNFCGFGMEVTCDSAAARAEVRRRGLIGAQALTLEKRYYQLRFFRPYVRLNARYRFNKRPHRFEVFAGYRGHAYIPGLPRDLDNNGKLDLYTYPGSLYDQRFPGGERGYASVVQVGIVLDDRDHEPDPHHGYWLETSVRGAHHAIGSTWNYAGANVTARIYAPLLRSDFAQRVRHPTWRKPLLVLASRYVVDVATGNLPLQEMVRVGGLRDYTAWGGEQMGRGIRSQRNAGRVKLLMQQELRSELVQVDFLGQTWRGGVQLFIDAGYVGKALTDLDRPTVSFGFGFGTRVLWGDNFVMRMDLAISPSERFQPGFYSGPDHLY